MVSTQPPTTVAPDSPFDVQVTADDANGNPDTNFTGPVTIALSNNPGGATLGGTPTVSAVNGVADFPNLTLDKAGKGYTLQATSDQATSATTEPFDVTGGPHDRTGVRPSGSSDELDCGCQKNEQTGK